MARDSSEVSSKIQLKHDVLDDEFLTAVELDDAKEDHYHSFSYVYPVPASTSFKAGEFPYMICPCGLRGQILSEDKWWVPAVEGTGPDEWATKP